MSTVRIRQPAVTRVLPHVQNRRFAVPDHYTQAVLLAGDSYTNYGAGDEYPNYLPPGLTSTDEGISGRAFAEVSNPGFSMENDTPGWITANKATGLFVYATTGGNDITAGTTLVQLQTAMQNIVGFLQAAGKRGIFTDSGMKTAWLAGQKTIAIDYSNWLGTYLAGEGMGFVPLIGTVADTTGPLPEYDLDGTHLNTAGCKFLAQLIMGQIKANALRVDITP